MSEHHDAAPAVSTDEITDEITEQKAVRLAKRERLNAAATGPGGGAYPVSALYDGCAGGTGGAYVNSSVYGGADLGAVP